MKDVQALRAVRDAFPGAQIVDVPPFPPQWFLDLEREAVARSEKRARKAQKKRVVVDGEEPDATLAL